MTSSHSTHMSANACHGRGGGRGGGGKLACMSVQKDTRGYRKARLCTGLRRQGDIEHQTTITTQRGLPHSPAWWLRATNPLQRRDNTSQAGSELDLASRPSMSSSCRDRASPPPTACAFDGSTTFHVPFPTLSLPTTTAYARCPNFDSQVACLHYARRVLPASALAVILGQVPPVTSYR